MSLLTVSPSPLPVHDCPKWLWSPVATVVPEVPKLTLIVPLEVIGPPVRPVPVATLVTVPPLSLSMPSANPAGVPVRPDHGAVAAVVAVVAVWLLIAFGVGVSS